MTFANSTPGPDRAAPTVWLQRRAHGATEDVPPPAWLCKGATGKTVDQPSIIAGAYRAEQPTEAVLARVLVVDDEALVRRTLALFLTRAGFATVPAASGPEALELLRADEACDLLVTDQSMPGMSGCELIGEARDLRPGLPALLVSGYDMTGGTEQLPGDVPLLRKPVERAAFLDQVSALLNTAKGKGRFGSS